MAEPQSVEELAATVREALALIANRWERNYAKARDDLAAAEARAQQAEQERDALLNVIEQAGSSLLSAHARAAIKEVRDV